MIKKKLDKSGFTLVELLISITIMTVMMAAMGQLLMATQKTGSLINTQAELRDSSRTSRINLSHELKKAVYFYSKTSNTDTNTDIIPKAVLDLNDTFKINKNSFPPPPNGSDNQEDRAFGNIFTFLSVDTTYNINDNSFKVNPVLVCKRGFVDNSSDSDLSKISNKDNLINNFTVQLLRINTIFLRKNKNNDSLDLVMYSQKGFFNAGVSGDKDMRGIILPEEIKYNDPSGTLTESNKLNAREQLYRRICYKLENDKKYTAIEVPDLKSMFDNASTANSPSLNFSLNTTNKYISSPSTTTNSNSTYGGTFTIIARGIGVNTDGTSITYSPYYVSSNYKSSLKLDASAVSSINSLDVNKLGFKVCYDSSPKRVTILIDNVKLVNEMKKPLIEHNEFSVTPKLN